MSGLRTAITGVRVFDGHQLTNLDTVVIQDGLISADDSLDGIAAGDVLDGAGGTLLPGLIDTHVHVNQTAHLQAAAGWGVTTVLDMGSKDLAVLATLKAHPGLPTLRSAGHPASAPNSRFVRKMGFPISSTVSDPADALRFVAERVAEGSDYIKILIEDPKIPGTKALDATRVAALVEAAHTAGLMTVAHIVSADTLLTALRSGVDVVTHTALTSELPAEVETLLARRPVTIIPTLTMMHGVRQTIGGKPLMRMLGLVKPSTRMDYSHAQATVATFRRAGMPILVGTDANDDTTSPFQPPHGQAVHEECQRLVDAGMTPLEVLKGATSTAATTFRLHDRGRIAAGYRADMVLVSGDPLHDIADTRRIRQVWIAGQRILNQ